jgi:CTP:molybdopterin cytidylyltransferase MocA
VGVAGLILAAGESRRMGFPKALLEFRGETFLDRLVGLLGTRCSPVVAVLGADAERIRAGLKRGGEAAVVVNRDYRLGQLSSLQCGLRALAAGTEGVLFTLVDHPDVKTETLDALLAPPRPRLRIPRHGGRRGHPVFFAGELIAEFLALDAGAAARDIVERHASEIEYVDVDDAGVLRDVDDRAAYQRLAEARP